MKCLALLALSGCQLVFAYDGISFDGAYQTVVLNGENGCEIPLWNAGDEDVVDVNIQQQVGEVTITVFGMTGDLLLNIYGERTFDGTVDGLAITATRDRDQPVIQPNCTTVPTIVLEGTLDPDRGVIAGTLTHLQERTGTACGSSACESNQTFRATRK